MVWRKRLACEADYVRGGLVADHRQARSPAGFGVVLAADMEMMLAEIANTNASSSTDEQRSPGQHPAASDHTTASLERTAQAVSEIQSKLLLGAR